MHFRSGFYIRLSVLYIFQCRHIHAADGVVQRRYRSYIYRCVGMDGDVMHEARYRTYLALTAHFLAVAVAVLQGYLRRACSHEIPVPVEHIDIGHRVTVDRQHTVDLIVRVQYQQKEGIGLSAVYTVLCLAQLTLFIYAHDQHAYHITVIGV